MLISAKATDTIYQEVLYLLRQHGVEEIESMQQHVLLGDGIFLGYRFLTATMQLDWLAQNEILVLKNSEGRILSQKQLWPQKTINSELTSNGERRPVAA